MSERFRVRWARSAQDDLIAIIEHIAAEDARIAREILATLKSAATKLERYPDRGRYVPELRAMDVFTHRELIHRPWRIIYRRQEHTVFILAVLDSRRDLESLLIERLVR